jgi:beta-fructofuranosidase
VDSSSIEIFVNDGDAVFTSRIFPDADEHFFKIQGDTFNRMWKLRNAVRDSFLI